MLNSTLFFNSIQGNEDTKLLAKDIKSKRKCYLICLDFPISEKLRNHDSQ